nr:unnamed protein product [Callosobruchus analis]
MRTSLGLLGSSIRKQGSYDRRGLSMFGAKTARCTLEKLKGSRW